MSELYDVVKRVVNASSMEEADELLYGENGIIISNSKEYYQNLVSTFIQKKELTIKNAHGKLIFDLDSAVDIWNTIFLGEYIKEHDTLNKEYETVKKDIIDKVHELYNQYSSIIALNRVPGADHEEINKLRQKKLQEIKDFLAQELGYDESEKSFPKSLAYFSKLESFIEELLDKKYRGVIETFYKIDWVDLGTSSNQINNLDATNSLKQAITIIHKFRNAIGHGMISEAKTLSVDSKNFKVSIPIEYIDGYSKGKIIPREEDKNIVEKTNSVASPILKSLNYNMIELQSFFHHVRPEWLNYLLEQVNNNYNELYKLNKDIIENSAESRFFLDKCGISFEELKEMPYEAFRFPDKTSEFLKAGLTVADLNLIANRDFFFSNWYKDIISKGLPRNILVQIISDKNCCTQNGIKLYNLGLSIQTIKELPPGAIENPDGFIRMLRGGLTISDASKLNDKAFEKPWVLFTFLNRELEKIDLNKQISLSKIQELPPEELKDIDIKKLKYYGNLNILLINQIKQLPPKVFNNYDECMRLLDEAIQSVSQLPDGVFDDYYRYEELLKKGITIDEITKLPVYKLEDSIVRDYVVKKKMSIDEIASLPDGAFLNTKLVEELLEKGRSMDEILQLPEDAFFEKDFDYYLSGDDYVGYLPKEEVSNTKQVKELLKKFSVEEISNLPVRAIVNPKIVFDLLDNHYSLEDIEKLPEYVFEPTGLVIDLIKKGFKFDDIKSLSEEAFFLQEEMRIFLKSNLSVKELVKLSNKAIRHPKEFLYFLSIGLPFDEVNKMKELALEDYEKSTRLLEEGLKVEDLNKIYFLDAEECIRIYNLFKDENIDLFKLPTDVINYYKIDLHIDNIKYLLNLVDNDYSRLGEFPQEFFACDLSKIEDLCKIYNLNVAKSIFHINDSKVIGLLIYCNNVFKNYQDEDFDKIDFNPIKFIQNAYNDTMDYKNNITDINMDKEKYIEQFVLHNNGEIRVAGDINNGRYINVKANILDKIRNAAIHFRIEPVYDNQGNVVPNKIHLYDKNENMSQDTNFNIILDINYLLEFARLVETSLNYGIQEMMDDVNKESSSAVEEETTQSK